MTHDQRRRIVEAVQFAVCTCPPGEACYCARCRQIAENVLDQVERILAEPQ